MIIHSFAYARAKDLESNIIKLDKYLSDFKSNDDLNVFFLGELTFTAYDIVPSYIKANKYTQTSEQMSKFIALAKKYEVCLCFGYIEEDNNNIYNAQIFIDHQGEIIHNHRKHNLTKKESEIFQKGESPVSSFEYAGYKFSLAICYDLFAKDFREYYDSSTDIFLHSLSDPQDGRFTLGFSGRYTNSIYIAANRYEACYNGHVGVYSSAGSRLVFSMGEERILSYQIEDRHLKRRHKSLLYLKVFFHVLRYPKKTIEYLNWSKSNQ